ncbi:preprotein translocase subunit SecA [Hydromonas duriensis]|uniref:Protein translocase subunit SecA n=1 Tax=Hydromonas duriensis TaxID=1527608 RepID=A0A4R6Y7H1_9BURK|nr:preprotein translocase subunit SecA [Hydromonas duriensis]TDR31280.1 protein translocase subunit secA [Hydromonas duriensis]
MVSGLLKKIFGSRNERLLKIYRRSVKRINGIEESLASLSDEALTAKTTEFKQRYQNGESLESMQAEAFAVVREASRRVLGMRHFDVQLIGGIVLHEGKIAEMRTGEGKTLMGTLAVYLNAITGKGVHVVTVNDYLARRDAQWMGQLYNFLGLSVGINLSGMERDDKIAAYQADITYGTNNEFGFDYLRDNLVYNAQERVQRPLHYAIVDEVDSILIDEARTPLIISGTADDNTELYTKLNSVPPMLIRQATEPKADEPEPEGDYYIDEKSRQIHLSEAGHEKVEHILEQMGLMPTSASLYDPQHISLVHYLHAALRAHTLFTRDKDYVVQDGEIVIVDEHTGRLMTGRRWSEGLHQAVEAKEGVEIQSESVTLASITFQNFFRMYEKLAGMTGTADTEAYEFQQIYGLETVVIPTHRKVQRIDKQDLIFRSAEEKHDAVINDIKDCIKRGQPTLVGTASIELSEHLSALLNQQGIAHNVLNAKQHEREALIISQAGRPGAVTIATNMAGRGTDIVLGGNVNIQSQFILADDRLTDAQKQQQIQQLKDEHPTLHDQVLKAGGLHIIGTERHESRRIDNQLRGRAGRQGDPGSSRFYLSMDDPLLRIFAGERLKSMMDRLKIPQGEAIESGMVSRSIESAQRKVEARNFDVRKQLLEYDDVANDQRRVMYAQRNELLNDGDIIETVAAMRNDVMAEVVYQYVPNGVTEEQWLLSELENHLKDEWSLEFPVVEWMTSHKTATPDDLVQAVQEQASETYQVKINSVGADGFHNFERVLMLQSMDQQWREHLASLDHLRQGIHLRSYAQKNPKQEYKREAFDLFSIMLERIKSNVTSILMNVKVQAQEQLEEAEQHILHHEEEMLSNLNFQHSDAPVADDAQNSSDQTASTFQKQVLASAFGEAESGTARVGRNEPCPCGSGKKYKQCHGRLA